MLRWLLESPYLAMRELRACFAVSYDVSSRNRNRISLSFISITSSRLNPLIVPSSFTSCTIRRTLWVNLPIKLLEPPPPPPTRKNARVIRERVLWVAWLVSISEACRTCGFHLDSRFFFATTTRDEKQANVDCYESNPLTMCASFSVYLKTNINLWLFTDDKCLIPSQSLENQSTDFSLAKDEIPSHTSSQQGWRAQFNCYRINRSLWVVDIHFLFMSFGCIIKSLKHCSRRRVTMRQLAQSNRSHSSWQQLSRNKSRALLIVRKSGKEFSMFASTEFPFSPQAESGRPWRCIKIVYRLSDSFGSVCGNRLEFYCARGI